MRHEKQHCREAAETLYLETDKWINKQHKTKQDHDQRREDHITHDDTVGTKQTAEIFRKPQEQADESRGGCVCACAEVNEWGGGQGQQEERKSLVQECI